MVKSITDTEVFRVAHSVFVHLNMVFSFLSFVLPQTLASILDSTGNSSHRLARLWGKWVLLCSGLKVKVRGTENLLPGRPQVIFCNHQSYFDVFCLLAHVPIQYRWLAKQELFRIPVFGWAMRRAGYLSVDRSNPRSALKSLKEAAERIRHGASIVIFPEGTRSADGTLQPFKAGGADLAIRSGVPAVPMVILGTHKVLPKGGLLLRRGPVEIRIGKPINTLGLQLKDKRRLLEMIRHRMLQLAGHENT